MHQRPLSIVLAIIIAFQACLTGFAVCSEGGCCHAKAETKANHVDDDHGDFHDHSKLVNTSERHPCDCTDNVIDGGEVVPTRRDHAPTPAPEAHVFTGQVHDYRLLITSMTQFVHTRAKDDAAEVQRLAVVRATRLLL